MTEGALPDAVAQLAITKSEETSFVFTACAFNIRFGREDGVSLQQSMDERDALDPLEPRDEFYTNMTERPWSERRIPLVQELTWNDVTLAGLQEVTYNQLEDIGTLLMNNYSDFEYRGVGRQIGLEKPTGPLDENDENEFGPLVFRSSIFGLKAWDTFWLSPTPFQVSKHPDAFFPRICIVACFSTPAGDLFAMSTHFDHLSDTSRAYAASLILHRAKHIAQSTSRPILLFGDFNSTPRGNDSTSYRILTGQIPPTEIAEDFRAKYCVNGDKPFSFHNLVDKTPSLHVSGNYATRVGFVSVQDRELVNQEYFRIDGILGGSNGGWDSKAHHIGNNFYDDGLQFSDHRPVFAKIEVKAGEFPL